MQHQVEFFFFNGFILVSEKNKARKIAQDRETVRKMSTFQKPNKLSPKKSTTFFVFIIC
jgi:alpha-D-ribose 1-methylphosphonate 5-triphosphate synthase subunit PhnH